MSIVIVLNDGQTFTDLEGCFALETPDHWTTEQIEVALKKRKIVCTDVWCDENGDVCLPFGSVK